MESYSICSLCLAYFTEHNVVNVHPYYSTNQNVIPFLRRDNIPLHAYAVEATLNFQ